jgi:hypothetical protein
MLATQTSSLSKLISLQPPLWYNRLQLIVALLHGYFATSPQQLLHFGNILATSFVWFASTLVQANY